MLQFYWLIELFTVDITQMVFNDHNSYILMSSITTTHHVQMGVKIFISVSLEIWGRVDEVKRSFHICMLIM